MSASPQQGQLFPSPTDREPGRALDELFQSTLCYRSSKAYFDLLQFISRFPKYSPFHCFLLYTQNPSVSYVATPGQWYSRFGRTIRRDARPLVILAPMQPVMFVYDMTDTEGAPLPKELGRPFDTQGKLPKGVYEKTLRNCEKRERIKVLLRELGALQAGYARQARAEMCQVGDKEYKPAKHVVTVNSNLAEPEQYSTLVHELGHIHAGHLGADADLWWPDRRDSSRDAMEWEAESVSYLVCRRLGLQTTSAEYLVQHVARDSRVPTFSLNTVLRVAGYIESLGNQMLTLRKEAPRKEGQSETGGRLRPT
jgi:hypothetical protein